MTELELAVIEARDRAKRALGGRPTSDVLALVAEVRRLRSLIKQAEWFDDSDYGETCPWCFGLLQNDYKKIHKPTCPAFPPNEVAI